MGEKKAKVKREKRKISENNGWISNLDGWFFTGAF